MHYGDIESILRGISQKKIIRPFSISWIIGLILNGTMLILLLVCFAGCTSNVKIGLQEVDNYASSPIVRAVRRASILGVTLDSEEKVVFNQNGGRLDVDGLVVIGVDTSGALVETEIGVINFVKFSQTDAAPRFMHGSDALVAARAVTSDSTRPARSYELPFWDVISFDELGGQLDSKEHTLTGTTTKGTEVEVSSAELLYVEVKTRNTFKTIRSGLTISFLALMANAVLDIVDLTQE